MNYYYYYYFFFFFFFFFVVVVVVVFSKILNNVQQIMNNSHTIALWLAYAKGKNENQIFSCIFMLLFFYFVDLGNSKIT